MPSIMTGASSGACFGFLLKAMLPARWNINPGVLAAMGMSATLCSVFRSPISLVVIIVEGTRRIDYSAGIIVAVMVSNWVGHYFNDTTGVYESELENDGNVYYLQQEPPKPLWPLTAADVAAGPVYGLPAVVSKSAVRRALATTHNGFPVYPFRRPNDDETTDPGPVLGLIRRRQLDFMLAEPLLECDAKVRPLPIICAFLLLTNACFFFFWVSPYCAYCASSF
jgi:chloride channel 7